MKYPGGSTHNSTLGRWLALQEDNLTGKSVTLRRNAKIADVSPCLALEDWDSPMAAEADVKQCRSNEQQMGWDEKSCAKRSSASSSTFRGPDQFHKCKRNSFGERLNELGLGDIDVASAKVCQQ